VAQQSFDLHGKVALVTGASSGIGRQQSLALAAAGAKVVLLARRVRTLEGVRDRIKEQGGYAVCLAADLLDREAVADIAAQAAAGFGDIDILINAAGVNYRENVDEITLDSWRRTVDLNLTMPFFLARECIPAMRQKVWGRVINLASLQSSRAFRNGLAYGAAKGGITQLTRAMAEAWSRYGINCNAIAPGFFRTGLTEKVFEDPDQVDRLAAQTAIGRNGDLQDLDGITVFLASPAADYITGQVIHVDGGFTAK
jgi:NAD(P)-dependent dehydrogenase (short-subunit alcohol dehydrogenase family)